MQVSQVLNGHPVDSPPRSVIAPPDSFDAASDLERWLAQLHRQVSAVLTDFVQDRCAEYIYDVPGAEFLTGLLTEFVPGGKYVRSTFTYLGWLSGSHDQNLSEQLDAPLRAAASTELLHAFALMQDDVMDQSALRRGRPALHVRLANWHRTLGLDGPAERFGQSAAILLADLCLVWAEQLFRDCGLPAPALARGWPRYDTLRGELAVGQFADLVNDARGEPTFDEVLDVTRRKSGNYTVRRPLELGAALAGADERTLAVLGDYGALVGEAFQLRDDVLGVYGRPDVTGKPSGGDLREHKATSVVVLAADMASPVQDAELSRLARRADLDDADLDRWRELIIETGATVRMEQLISERVTAACDRVAAGALNPFVRHALCELAVRYTDRAR
ncbi:MAG TPA: polyprenyl synthetase family protein [Streptosporangiaceae bacterium]|jgi:geranylgeranyl diphosphate synthase type I